MGWGKDAAERLKKREVAGRRTRKESAQDRERIGANAENLRRQLVEWVQDDVKESNDYFHRKTSCWAKFVNSNHLGYRAIRGAHYKIGVCTRSGRQDPD